MIVMINGRPRLVRADAEDVYFCGRAATRLQQTRTERNNDYEREREKENATGG